MSTLILMSEIRAALVETTNALLAIHRTRGMAMSEQQQMAMNELKRVIEVGQRALIASEARNAAPKFSRKKAL